MTASILELPALETSVVIVKSIDRVEVGDKIRFTINADRLGYPPAIIQASTFKDWHAALADRSRELQRPITISVRNYHHGDRRIVLMEWAS